MLLYYLKLSFKLKIDPKTYAFKKPGGCFENLETICQKPVATLFSDKNNKQNLAYK